MSLSSNTASSHKSAKPKTKIIIIMKDGSHGLKHLDSASRKDEDVSHEGEKSAQPLLDFAPEQCKVENFKSPIKYKQTKKRTINQTTDRSAPFIRYRSRTNPVWHKHTSLGTPEAVLDGRAV